MVQWLELKTLNQAIRDQISVEPKFILICNKTNILKSFKSLQLAHYYLFNNNAVRFYGVMVTLRTLNPAIRVQVSVEPNFILSYNKTKNLKSFKSL